MHVCKFSLQRQGVSNKDISPCMRTESVVESAVVEIDPTIKTRIKTRLAHFYRFEFYSEARAIPG